MINPKNICICSCIGFFLSFFIGLVSGVHFSHILLRAVIFAAIFAGLCIGVTFIYTNFLSAETGGFSSDVDSMPQKQTGSVVNIVVDDANLADDGMTPKFTVLGNRSSLVAASKTEPAAVSGGVASEPVVDSAADSANASAPAFQPVSLGGAESSAPVSGETQPAHSADSVSAPVAAPTSAEKLDELPDIGGMDIGASSDIPSTDSDPTDDVVSDSEFATGGAKLREQPISGDTNVMAKAIQTLLAQDNN